mgnify:CR=1 FL=1
MEIEHPVSEKVLAENEAEEALKTIVHYEQHVKTIREKLDLMSQYYQNLFPFNQLFEWIHCRTKPEDRCKREISYIARSQIDINEEFCIRHRGYRDVHVFKSEVLKLLPLRIDIGPEFNLHSSEANKVPAKREYVIDIDMSDYDNLRTCCQGKTLRRCCWKFMVAAYEVLKMILEEAFGFKHILWVFSGRRGIHAWVCDEEAARMPNPLRKAITNFLNFSVNNEKMNVLLKEDLLKKRSYSLLEKTYAILEKYRNFLLEEQKVLQKPAVFNRVLTIAEKYVEMPFTESDQNEIAAIHDPQLQYKTLLDKIKINIRPEMDIRKFDLEFVVGFLYPKIDAHVSAEMNHLLKAPFNIHMDSLKLSVPLIDVENFDPENCLTLEDLVLRGGVRGSEKFENYLHHFENFITQIKK